MSVSRMHAQMDCGTGGKCNGNRQSHMMHHFAGFLQSRPIAVNTFLVGMSAACMAKSLECMACAWCMIARHCAHRSMHQDIGKQQSKTPSSGRCNSPLVHLLLVASPSALQLALPSWSLKMPWAMVSRIIHGAASAGMRVARKRAHHPRLQRHYHVIISIADHRRQIAKAWWFHRGVK
jgi:hypothetical protein